MALVPDEAVSSSHQISPSAFTLYVCYCSHRNKFTGLSWPGRKTINQQTGICLTYISTLKKQLADAGWIEIVDGKVRPLKGFSETRAKSNDSTLNRSVESNSSTEESAYPTEKSNHSSLQSNRSIAESDYPTEKSNRSTLHEPVKDPAYEPAKGPHTHEPGEGVCVSSDLRPEGQPLLSNSVPGAALHVLAGKSIHDEKTFDEYRGDPANFSNGKPLQEGWKIARQRDGLDDKRITAWIERRARPTVKKVDGIEKIDCPDCEGAGAGVFVTKDILEDKGARRCTHPRRRQGAAISNTG